MDEEKQQENRKLLEEEYNNEWFKISREWIDILAEDNKLGRTLIPFFRHDNYLLSKNEYKEYKDYIKQIIDKRIII